MALFWNQNISCWSLDRRAKRIREKRRREEKEKTKKRREGEEEEEEGRRRREVQERSKVWNCLYGFFLWIFVWICIWILVGGLTYLFFVYNPCLV